MILLLDYDGTLTPIVPDPNRAYIERERKEFLDRLSKEHTLAIVTGRDMKSFRSVFGKVPKSLYVITSHGAKLYKGERLLKELFPSKVPDLSPLREKVRKLEGVVLEEKEGCFALHFRNFKGDEEHIKKLFSEFIKDNPPAKVIEGKKVLEGVYGDFDKGKGVEEFLKFLGWEGEEGLLYIGDDTTDLYAMEKVRSLGGRTIFVGTEKPLQADEVLPDVEAVYRFLESLRSQ